MNKHFKVKIINNAEKQLKKKFKFHRAEAVMELKKLSKNPYFGKKLKGKMDGKYSLKFSINGTEYRSIYDFDKEDRVVTILALGKRESVYDNFQRNQ